MKIFKRQALWTLVTVLLLGGAVHFFLNAYQDHRGQRALLERIQFREDFVRRQITEMAQKRKVIERVNAFVGGAEDLGLAPSNWTRYEVNIETPLRFNALDEILRQCTNTPYYYFQPKYLKVHLAGQNSEDGADEGAEASQAVAADDGDAQGDLLLQLKGTFLARRR
jgi:hypothetical protein